MTDFVNCAQGDLIPAPSVYVRVTLEESFVASLLHGLETRSGDDSYLASAVSDLLAKLGPGSPDDLGNFVTAVSGVEVAPGDRVAVQDFKVYPRAGVTFAVVASRLNDLASGLTVHTVERRASVDSATRGTEVQKQNQQIASESSLDTFVRYLKNAGTVALVILLLGLVFVVYTTAKRFV